MMNARIAALQPGLLDVFRLFGWLQVGIGVVYAGLVVLGAGGVHSAAFMPLLSACALLLLVASRTAQNWMGAWYLPVMLTCAIVHVIGLFGLWWQWHVTIPLVKRILDGIVLPPLDQVPVGIDSGEVIASFSLLLVLSNLFFLALLVSWQYDLRCLVAFCAITTLLDLVLNVGLVVGESIQALPNLGIILFRNLIFLQLGTVTRHLLRIQSDQRTALIEANRQLSRYAAAAEELAITRERNRLARELHDTLAHTLSAATVQLEAAQARWATDNEKAYAAVEKTLTITRAGLNETRRALQALRATPLENLGLRLALHELIALMQQRSAAVIRFELPATLDVLPHEVEQTLYRATQEGIENAVRHARAHQIALLLKRSTTCVTLTVEDDGIGFNPQVVTNTDNHFGLRGLGERARALGGYFQITSESGRGTRLHMELPL